MKILTAIYGAFRDREGYRDYFDLVFTDRSLIIVWLGAVPVTYLKRAPLPRTVELHLLRVTKEKMRRVAERSVNELLKSCSSTRCKEIPYTEIALISLKEIEVPIPPILRKPPSDPRERPKYTQQVLEIAIYLGGNKVERFYTTPRLKKMLKQLLKDLMLVVPGLEV